MKKIAAFILLAFLSCNRVQETCIDAPAIAETAPVVIERLENRLFGATNPGEVLQFLQNYPVLTREFLGVNQYPSDTILAREIFR